MTKEEFKTATREQKIKEVLELQCEELEDMKANELRQALMQAYDVGIKPTKDWSDEELDEVILESIDDEE